MSNTTTTPAIVNIPKAKTTVDVVKLAMDFRAAHPIECTTTGTSNPPIIIPRAGPIDPSVASKQLCKENLEKYLDRHHGDPESDAICRRMLELVNSDDLDDESRNELTKVFISQEPPLPPIKSEDDEDDDIEIMNARGLMVKTIKKPAELIQGILYQGGKMSFNAPSKMGKTWSLLHLGISLSEGMDWFGFKTTKSRILFINPELQNFSFEDRIQNVARNISGVTELDNFDYTTTRGKQLSSAILLPMLRKMIEPGKYGAIILDSIYKLYPTDTEENSNSDVGRFLNGLETLAAESGAAIIYSHHYSKGNQASKAAIDRSSGAGAWSRDPDTVVSVTEHEKDKCYTVEFNLRDFKPVDPIAITINWPNVVRDASLNPKALKTTQFQAKYTSKDILKLLENKAYTATELQKEVREELGMSSGTFYGLWPEVKEMPGVDIKDKRWVYSKPASDPANN